MSSVRCAYCPGAADTRDHILPRGWGGDELWMIAERVWNFKPSCGSCNRLRAICGHCPGAMAALRAVAGDEGDEGRFGFQMQIAMLWGWCGARSQALVAGKLGFDLRDDIRTVFKPMDQAASEIRPVGVGRRYVAVPKSRADGVPYLKLFKL